MALVGESGCGKRMTMLSVIGLHPQPPAEIASGEVLLGGVDLVRLSEEERRSVRGARLAMVYRDLGGSADARRSGPSSWQP